MSKAEVRGFEALLGGVAFVDFVESHAEAWMVLGRRAVVDVLKQNYKWRFSSNSTLTYLCPASRGENSEGRYGQGLKPHRKQGTLYELRVLRRTDGRASSHKVSGSRSRDNMLLQASVKDPVACSATKTSSPRKRPHVVVC